MSDNDRIMENRVEKTNPPPSTFQWLTTNPNPSHPGTGFDAGQRGWRLHAVMVQEGEKYEDYKRRPALCGLGPRHGWGLDLFIEDECSRCQAAMTKREGAGEEFLDLAKVAEVKRQAAAAAKDAERCRTQSFEADDE